MLPALSAIKGLKSGGGGNSDDPVERQYQAADRALQQGNSALAKDLLDKLLTDYPTHFRSLMLQSAIALGKAQFAKAEMYARAAVKSLPPASVISLERAVAISQLIEALTKQGKLQEADVFTRMLGRANERKETGQVAISIAQSQEVASVAEKNGSKPVDDSETPLVSGQLMNEQETGEMLKEASVSVPSPMPPDKQKSKAKIKDMSPSPLWSKEELHERKVVYVGMRQREVLNAFREVRIRLLQKNNADNMVVMVSSLKAAGGGSFFAFNLAATFALDPHKTALYVDCNPYESSAERYVNGVINFGLSQYLTDEEIQLEKIIYPSGVDRVRVIPTAGCNESAAELFNSERMKTFIAEIKERYPDRFIILDAPSVESSTEARILAQHCDQALLLVPFGRATQDEVLSGVDAVGRGRFAGLVFNH
jgi:Mrp family chromosome partitioning ATPase